MKSRIYILSLIFVLAISTAAFSKTGGVPGVALSEQEKLEEIQKKLELSKQKLVETKKKEEQALFKLVVTKKKLNIAEKSLKKANTKITLNQEQIQKLAVDLKTTNDHLLVKSAQLKNRLREIYKNSSVNYLELLFSSASMSDFINRSYFFTKIIEKDGGLISGIAEDFNELKTDKEHLTKKTNEIKQLAEEISAEKEVIAHEATEINETYGELKGRRENYEKQVAELEKSSAEMEKIILAKISERKKQNLSISGNTGALDWPMRGRITSNFGYRRHPYFGGGRHMHTGMDIAAPFGDIIRAADGGVVIFAGWWDGYGKAVVIDHGSNISTLYAHMSRIYLQAGNAVKKGQMVGLCGSTGYSTGPHLHFEIRVKGKPQDPRKYLP
ncbi:peptidoglycan DD-metalloendopeptidase family protein [Candidatus Saganbacteria bacterium]|nr:peptidoglycan DD-metalloendopeptidase family protein [Candidatus Saganbacteria bacterium]